MSRNARQIGSAAFPGATLNGARAGVMVVVNSGEASASRRVDLQPCKELRSFQVGREP